MKLYKSLLIIATTMLTGLWVAGCSDDATLENSKEVYIDITPDNISMTVGDTVPISATVMNTEGKLINTPVYWSLDDESVVKLLGDTALTCVVGSLDRGTTAQYSTTLRCTLPGNKKYAIKTITVTPSVPNGVTAESETVTSYNSQGDIVWFIISPKTLLDDYIPQIEVSNDNIILDDPALVYEKEEGRVGVKFTSDRKGGDCVITLSIGEGDSKMSASCTINMAPEMETFLWDDGSGTGPSDVAIPRETYGNGAADPTYSLIKNLDLNSASYAIAGSNLQTGYIDDINEAMALSRWEAVSGSSVLITGIRNEVVENVGFDSYLNVVSGTIEGATVFNFIAPDTILEVTFNVIDFKKQPVDEITTNAPDEGIEMFINGEFFLQTGVIPVTSYVYHKPVVTATDPTVIQVGEYDGNTVRIKGLKEGKTDLVLTANDKTLTIPVTVNDAVQTVRFNSSNQSAAFVGQTINWDATATMYSGKASTLPIVWSSSNESVATVNAGRNEETTGDITAKSAGTTDITATVQGVSATASLEVLPVPSDKSYTKDNTSSVSVSVVSRELRISFKTSDGETIEIKQINYRGQYDFNITDMSNVTVTYNGIGIIPESGTLTGTDNDPVTIFSFVLNFTIGDNSFTLKATDLEGL